MKEKLYYGAGGFNDPDTIPAVKDHWKVSILEEGEEKRIWGIHAPGEDGDIPPDSLVMTLGEARKIYELLAR